MIGIDGERVADRLTTNERRRPRRAENVSPHLVPLLRGLRPEQDIDPPPAYADGRTAGGDLSPACGIMVAIGASALVWAALGSVLWWISM